MAKYFTIVFGIFFVGFLTIKIIIFYELPEYEGTISIQGIIDTVSVFTDDYGTPHVFAENENDLFIIEDAAHAVGSSYLNRAVGNCQYSDIIQLL